MKTIYTFDERTMMMKRLLSFISIFTILLVGLTTVNKTDTSYAVDTDDKCIPGINITDKIKPNLNMYIFGLDLDAYYNSGQVNMVRHPDNTVIQQWHYVVTDFTGSLDNTKKQFKKGDYFVLNLPEGARIGGLLHKESAFINDIKITDPVTGEEKVFAEARYEYNTNTVYYVLTDYIENKDTVNFGAGVEWTVAENYALYNKPYTFTSKFGANEVTKQFENYRDANDNTRPIPTTVVYVNPKNNYQYEQVGVHTLNETQKTNGFRVKYNSPSGNPFAADGVFKVYEVPDGYPIPDSYYIDRTQLVDITDQLKKTVENGTIAYTIEKPASKKYMYYLLNRYTPEQDLVTGFEALSITGNEPLSLTQNQGSGSEQRIVAGQISTWVESTKGLPIICKVIGKVSVTKVDSVDNSKTLEGATFALFDKTTGNKLTEVTTGKDGTALFDSVEKGTYVLKEVKSPTGYKLSTEEREVTISEKDQVVELGNFINEKVPTDKKIPPKKTPKLPEKLVNTGLSSFEYTLITMILLGFTGTVFSRKLKDK